MSRNLPKIPMDELPILGVDVETTGFSRKDRIIEVACVLLLGDEVIDTFETFVSDAIEVPEEITEITGITTEDIIDAPPWAEVEADLLSYLERGAVWAAHNMSFDARMLRGHFTSEWPTGIPTICTKILGRRDVRGLPSYSLQPFCEHMKIELTDWHRAKADAEACARLARALTRGKDLSACVTRSSEEWN